MGMYIAFEQVRIRLLSKVRFTTEEDDENKMHVALANRLIAEAEGQVEMDLSPRYASPFTYGAEPFSAYEPSHSTRSIIATLVELLSCIRILETDFGRGTAMQGDKYVETLQNRYDKIVEKLLMKKTDKGVEASGYKYPPLVGLRLNYMNECSDDGFAGQVLLTTVNSGDYPQKQINDPSMDFNVNWW